MKEEERKIALDERHSSQRDGKYKGLLESLFTSVFYKSVRLDYHRNSPVKT